MLHFAVFSPRARLAGPQAASVGARDSRIVHDTPGTVFPPDNMSNITGHSALELFFSIILKSAVQPVTRWQNCPTEEATACFRGVHG
jgi:hypothetical protein